MTMRYTVEVFQDVAELSRRAADELARRAREVEETRERFSLCLAGGSTPKVLYALLAEEPYRSQLDWSRIHVFWGDERCVPPDHADSNYRMAQEALLSKVPVPAENVHRIFAEKEPHVAAREYEQTLRQSFGLSEGALPRFDFVLLGMGADGHTASLFPGTSAIHETQRLVVAYFVKKLQAHRVTLTPPVLNNAAQVIFLVAGADKARTLREVLKGAFQPDALPSQIVQPTNGSLLWLVDQPSFACAPSA
jgi:6-phosphogluconolactonase